MRAMPSVCALGLLCGGLSAQNLPLNTHTIPAGDTWTRSISDSAKRGTLHDRFQHVRGDTGKWRDEPLLQHVPAPAPKKPLDDWADECLEKTVVPTGNDENWLVFRTKQLDDNDRVWVESVKRDGDSFTVVVQRAMWQGKYFKTFTFYGVFAFNLGKLKPGAYQAKCIVKPTVFQQFEGGRPNDMKTQLENWSKDEKPDPKTKASEFTVSFRVAG